jgi:hypothetical protein
MPKYKIKADMSHTNGEISWYVAYVKYWWWPCWLEIKGINFSRTQEQAERYIEWHKNHTLYINDTKTIGVKHEAFK